MVDLFGEPWANFVPRQGELSASPTHSANVEGISEYRPLDKVLGRIQENFATPIEFDFPLAYYRFIRWRTFPDAIARNSQPINFKLAYAEFELYGRGFVGESRFETKVADLGQAVILGRIEYAVSQWRRREGAWTESGGHRRWQPGELVPVDDAEAGFADSLQDRQVARLSPFFHL